MQTIENIPDHPGRIGRTSLTTRITNQLPDWLTQSEVTTRIADHGTATDPPQATPEPIRKASPCSPHNDPRNYIATPCRSRDGWERVSCSKCDCFVGYRPKEAKPDYIDIDPQGWLPDELTRKRQVEAGQAVVANVKRDHRLIAWAQDERLAVFVDRRGPFGNPFIIGRDGGRADVCDRFEEWIGDQSEILGRIDEIRGRVLVCHCYPQRCHGETLVRLAHGEAAHGGPGG